MRRKKEQEPPRKEQPEDPAEKLVTEILQELEEENQAVAQVEEKIDKHKKRLWTRIGGTAGFVALVVGIAYLVLALQTYHQVQLLDVYQVTDAGSSSYEEFGRGVLKYNRNGVSYITQRGKESWNQSSQFRNPIYACFGETAVVADQDGNSIMVFDQEGLKGEIETTLPIQKVVVSGQGIVGAILKKDTTPQVVCYDVAGNLLVEHKTSLGGTGYPLDISLSENGEMLVVSYLHTAEGKVTGKVAYFNFDSVGQDETDYQVAQAEFLDEVVGDVFFLDKDTSVIVGEKQIQIYEGTKIPERKETIDVDGTIQNVFHNDKYFGVLVKKNGTGQRNLLVYRKNGREKLNKTLAGDYDRISISGGQVVMYRGKHCQVYTLLGNHRFYGEMEQSVRGVIPMWGINKYMVINEDGIQVVRFVK